MRLTLPIAALSVGLLSCGGHVQREGLYTLSAERIVRDECNLAQSPSVFKALELRFAGDVVYGDYSLFHMAMVGSYLESSVLAPSERFSLDGSAANVNGVVNGQECLLDLVTVHLDAQTREPGRFSGNLSIKLDARRPESCVCELWLSYEAKQVEP